MRTNISEMSDITMITLAKPGDDQMCVTGLELRVTGQMAIERNYGETSCAWVGGDQLLSVRFEELRSAPSWLSVVDIIPTGIPAEDLRAMIMGQFGHFLHGFGELRNGSALTTAFVNDRRLKVKVPIRVYDVPLLGNVSSDVRFDLALSDTANGTRLSIENVDADSSDILGFFLPIIGWKIMWETSQTIEASLNGIRPSGIGGVPPGLRPCFKPDASVAACTN